MMKPHRLCISAMALAAALAAPAYGQDTAAEPEVTTGVADIIVTAQKRAQNVQDVPIAVSAFDAAALTERAVGDVAQLANITPNVTFDAGTPFSGTSAVLSAYIRGIGANDFAFNIDPGVGIYLDGVYLARTVGANQDLLDVERVEILKGPQGTLFGRNTIGGAVQIVTREPGDEFMIRGDATTGSFDRVLLRATADIPLGKDFALAVTGSFHDRDGYMTRVASPFGTGAANVPSDFVAAGYETQNDEGDDHSWSGRAKLVWDNDGAFKVTLTGDYSNIDQGQIPNSVLATTEFVGGPFAGLAANDLVIPIPPPLGPLNTALDVVTGSSGFLFAGLYNFCIGATAAQIAARNAGNLCGPRSGVGGFNALPGLASVNIDADPSNDRLPYDSRWISTDPDVSYATGNNFSELENWGFAGTIDVDLGENIALKSITAYRELHWLVGMDLDNSPLAMLHTSFEMNQWQFSEELQLTGDLLDNKLNYVLGAYYFKEKGNLHDWVTFSEGLLQVDGPNDLETENYAFFGQIDWRIADWVGVTAGGRYTHEKKKFEGFQSDLNGFNYKLFNCMIIGTPCSEIIGFNDPSQPLRYFPAGTQTKTFNNFSPKLGVQFYPTDDIMIYGSWSKGYKTGGWTTRLSNPLPTAPDFDEEKAESWEVGIKSELADRKLRINAAAFTTKYTGIQLNFQQGVSPTIQNAGDARIKGFEIEVTAVPTEIFSVTASVGYTDAYYTDVLPQSVVAANPFQAGVFEGADLPKTPDWKFNVSPRVELPIGSGTITFLADYTYTTSIWNDTERTFLLERPATNILGLSASYRPNEMLEFTVGGTNILDERYLTTGQAQIAGGQIYGTYSRPAEWYLRVGAKF